MKARLSDRARTTVQSYLTKRGRLNEEGAPSSLELLKARLHQAREESVLEKQVDPHGPRGKRGERGQKGAQGLVGPRGREGAVGTAGGVGLIGPAGRKGDPGQRGPQGGKGDRGPRGLEGEKGPPGTGVLNILGGGGGIVVAGRKPRINDVIIRDSKGRWSTKPEDLLGVTTNTIEIDDADPLTYFGFATPGSLKSAAVWKVLREEDKGGGDFEYLYADGDAKFDNVWDDRTSLSYS